MWLISTKIDPRDPSDHADVYNIQLNSDELKYYIEITGCKFSNRLK